MLLSRTRRREKRGKVSAKEMMEQPRSKRLTFIQHQFENLFRCQTSKIDKSKNALRVLPHFHFFFKEFEEGT